MVDWGEGREKERAPGPRKAGRSARAAAATRHQCRRPTEGKPQRGQESQPVGRWAEPRNISLYLPRSPLGGTIHSCAATRYLTRSAIIPFHRFSFPRCFYYLIFIVGILFRFHASSFPATFQVTQSTILFIHYLKLGTIKPFNPILCPLDRPPLGASGGQLETSLGFSRSSFCCGYCCCRLLSELNGNRFSASNIKARRITTRRRKEKRKKKEKEKELREKIPFLEEPRDPRAISTIFAVSNLSALRRLRTLNRGNISSSGASQASGNSAVVWREMRRLTTRVGGHAQHR